MKQETKLKEEEMLEMMDFNSSLDAAIKELHQNIAQIQQDASLRCDELIHEFQTREANAQTIHDQEKEGLEEKIQSLEDTLKDLNNQLHDQEVERMRLIEDKDSIQEKLSRTNSERIHFSKQLGETQLEIQSFKHTKQLLVEELQLKNQTIQTMSHQMEELNNNLKSQANHTTIGVQVSPGLLNRTKILLRFDFLDSKFRTKSKQRP